MSQRTLNRSFSAGELTPELYGRIDLGKFESGLGLCRNFIVLPHGPASNRPGTEFVAEVKDSTKRTRLIPFTYSITQTMAIEVGETYFRFHTQAATLDNLDGTPYEVVSPYLEADLFDIHYVQSADVLTLAHPNYPVMELRRLGALSWTLTAPTFAAPTNPPTDLIATPNGGGGSTSYQYVVTSINTENLEESIQSAGSNVIGNDLDVTGHTNSLTWTAATGSVVRYNVYKSYNGQLGYVGQTSGTSFIDNNITADTSQTPPVNDTGFNDMAGDYPGAVSYFEQRRVFAGTTNLPQNFWGTRSGTESNMAYSIPTRDDDRIAFRIAARQASAIRHIVPAASLILLTPSCEFRLNPDGSVLTPSNIQIKPQSYVGCNNVTPVVVDSNYVLFVQARGGHVREMSYNYYGGGYVTADICLLAPHLFDYQDIVDISFVSAPYPILWCVSTNGQLLGMTYVPQQQIAAWHHHDTINGAFEAVCSITESPAVINAQPALEDMLYCIINRTIGGVQKRYVERLHTRNFVVPQDAFFVDCGARYEGTLTSTISGLTWLEGQTVSILADGAVVPQQVVTDGAISLPVPASVVLVGLPITADVQTLPLTLQIDNAAGIGKTKNVNKVFIRTNRSGGISAGPDFDDLTEVKERSTEPYGSPPALKTGEVSVVVTPSWGPDGAVCLRQSDPLPLTVVSIAMDVAPGG